jgi:Domain of Unknown Function (DUF1080)
LWERFSILNTADSNSRGLTMHPPNRLVRLLAIVSLVLAIAPTGRTDDSAWVELTGLDAWKSPVEGWFAVGSVGLDLKDPKKLTAESGTGVIYNGPSGKAKNLVSKETFGDVDLHVEFLIPKGSNSGVKFQSVYEIQIFDSFGSTKKLTGRESGGVYPRSEEKPKYHQIDDGYAPLANASLAPGEWQILDATFIAPRFDSAGNKIACARITAVLNGKTVQDNLEVHSPTGSAWRDKEKTTGPILIQADHGPVAFRNLKARRLPAKS